MSIQKKTLQKQKLQTKVQTFCFVPKWPALRALGDSAMPGRHCALRPTASVVAPQKRTAQKRKTTGLKGLKGLKKETNATHKENTTETKGQSPKSKGLNKAIYSIRRHRAPLWPSVAIQLFTVGAYDVQHCYRTSSFSTGIFRTFERGG